MYTSDFVPHELHCGHQTNIDPMSEAIATFGNALSKGTRSTVLSTPECIVDIAEAAGGPTE